ncbi:MAG: CBS domain-containing protein [Planctomycetes bacterium]|nr:CBS domain-containing protein [Planctomycetota bacterium]
MAAELNLDTEVAKAAAKELPLIVEPTVATSEVLRLLQMQRAGSVLICRGETLLGIFTERDALKLMAARADLTRPIEAVMTSKPATVPPTASIGEAIGVMARGGYRRLPIVDDSNRLLGVIKVSNIVSYFVEHFPQAVFNLPPQPNVVMPEREGA